MADVEVHTLTIPMTASGQRLDQTLANLLPDYSRTRIKEWIEAGEVLVDGRALRPRDKLLGGEKVRVNASLQEEGHVAPEFIALDIVYQDRDVYVINKPPGLVVHPGAGNAAGTLQNALIHHAPKLAELPRAGIVHRLDKDTSGLMVIARTIAAHTALTRMIEAHEVQRHYEAICAGVMTAGGTINAPIDRHPVDRVKMAIRGNGREAITHYRVLHRYRAHTHVRVTLETGRTHQIRVHLAHIRYPIVGDGVYGGRLGMPKGATEDLVAMLRNFPRQALHAAQLEFDHPVSGKRFSCEAPLPEDMQALLAVLSADEKVARKASATRRP